MLYKFTYPDVNKVWKSQVFTDEKKALNFFNILVASKLPFRVDTITKRQSRW